MMTNITNPKNYHEQFTQFFENPNRKTLRNLIWQNTGEYDYLDFKKEWPKSPSIARHMLAMANSGCGVLVIGVQELEDKSLDACGLQQIIDKADILKQTQKFLPEFLKPLILDFKYEESEYPKLKGKIFQVLMIEDQPDLLPFVCRSNGDNIQEGAIYVRSQTESKVANNHEVQKIINRRIETMHSSQREISIKEHLEELKILYEFIPRRKSQLEGFASIIIESAFTQSNPKYPKESVEEFVSRMIDKKKKMIENLLCKVYR